MFVELTSSEIEIKIEEVLRLLSNGKPKRDPSIQLKSRIEQWIQQLRSLIHPCGIYTILDIVDLPEKPYFTGATQVAFAVCTIGRQLPDLVWEYMTTGKMSDGVIIDAIGSVAADSVADMINNIINAEASSRNLVPSMRYSPGYCDMPIIDQSLIFNSLDHETIQVILKDSYMMDPIKSVSFAVNLGDQFINRCSECEKRSNCPHRR